MTDAENGELNPLGLNCLRSFPIYGPVVWGARTLVGADAMASEWKYVPVRRFALYLEESLYRGLKWVVFEPNAEPLWAADPAQRERLHAEPVPAGRLPGHHAGERLFREVRQHYDHADRHRCRHCQHHRRASRR